MSVFLGNGPSTDYHQHLSSEEDWTKTLTEQIRWGRQEDVGRCPPTPVLGPVTTDNTTLRCLRYHYTAAALVVSIKMLLSHLSWLHCKNISIKRAGHHNLPVDRWTQRISAWIVNVWAIWTNTMKSQRWPRLLIDCTVIAAAQDPFAQLHVWLTVGLQQH